MNNIFVYEKDSIYDDDKFLVITENEKGKETSIRKDEIVSLMWNFNQGKLEIKTKNDCLSFDLLCKDKKMVYECIEGKEFEDEIVKCVSINNPFSFNFINIFQDKISVWRFATDEDYENGLSGGIGTLGIDYFPYKGSKNEQ